MSSVDATSLRRAILTSVPVDLFASGTTARQYVHVPRAHVRALDPENMLVVGGRGTGKSFWWHTLLDDDARSMLIPAAPALGRKTVRVYPGWSTSLREELPDKSTIASIRRGNASAYSIWRTVFLRQIVPSLLDRMTWAERVAWVNDHPEQVAAALRQEDDVLASNNSVALVLFDALDRVAENWPEIRELTQGLLQLLLDLRSTRALRMKVFLRTDMMSDRSLMAFPDSSKLLHGKVELLWPREELYALLWQHLGNAPEGADAFRALSLGWTREHEVYRAPELLRSDPVEQRRVFSILTGPWMGANPKRGTPYTWIPTHLSDAHGLVTPRSFLTAVRVAADRATSTSALDVKSIHAGVQQASEIRVAELVLEDYPWTNLAMKALAGLQVPCESQQIRERWHNGDVLAKLSGQEEARGTWHDLTMFEGLRDALIEIGVLEDRGGDRFNVPDIYRVEFRITRKGGVPVVR